MLNRIHCKKVFWYIKFIYYKLLIKTFEGQVYLKISPFRLKVTTIKTGCTAVRFIVCLLLCAGSGLNLELFSCQDSEYLVMIWTWKFGTSPSNLLTFVSGSSQEKYLAINWPNRNSTELSKNVIMKVHFTCWSK